MELTVMKCPNCAGEIQYAPGSTECICPYCDSQVHINKSLEEAQFEQDNINLAAAKEKYFTALNKWRKIKYVCMAVAFMMGILMALQKNGLFDGIGFAFMFAGGPVVHAFAPVPPKQLERKLNKKEKPTSTPVLFGIFFAMVVIGFSIVPSKDEDNSDNDTSLAIGVEAEAGSK